MDVEASVAAAAHRDEDDDGEKGSAVSSSSGPPSSSSVAVIACPDVDDDDERPVMEPGEVIYSDNGTHSYRVEDLVGEGRCCLVYSAHSTRDASRVALKFYKRGRLYEGAVKREQYILQLLSDPAHNVVTNYGNFRFKGAQCQAMERLDANVRQVIFRSGRRGLSAWGVRKFARDVLSALSALHARDFVHADLKPANVMWSGGDGKFKLIDFGLTFHVAESDLHQVQTRGYQAPEAAAWNSYKEELKKSRKRKLQGTYVDLTAAGGEDVVREACVRTATDGETEGETALNTSAKDEWPSESSGVFTASEMSQCLSPPNRQDSRASMSDLSTAGDVTPVHSVANVRHSTIVEVEGDPSCNLAEQDSNTAADTTAEWRRGGGRRRHGRRSSRDGGGGEQRCRLRRPPRRPGPPADIWSFGCLLYEVLTGSKLFRSGAAGGALASVLRPAQLVEMYAGETEAAYAERGLQEVFSEAKDLVTRCLSESPSSRPTAAEALESHRLLLREDLEPEERDMTSMPTSILLLKDALPGQQEEGQEGNRVHDMLKGIRCGASKFGAVSSVTSRGSHVYVEFAEEASRAREGLADQARTTAANLLAMPPSLLPLRLDRVLFYPADLWARGVLL